MPVLFCPDSGIMWLAKAFDICKQNHNCAQCATSHNRGEHISFNFFNIYKRCKTIGIGLLASLFA